MSYSSSKLFQKIYRKWQKRKQRNKFNGNVLETAKKEFYALEDSLKMLGKPLHIQSSSLRGERIEKITEEPPAPPVEEDETISVLGMSMKNNKWKELMLEQRNVGTAKTLTPDQKMFLYLKSLFKNDK